MKDEPAESLIHLKRALSEMEELETLLKRRKIFGSTSPFSNLVKHKSRISGQEGSLLGKSTTDDGGSKSKEQVKEPKLDLNYKATIYYNIACCYQRLDMLEECVENLELSTKALD